MGNISLFTIFFIYHTHTLALFQLTKTILKSFSSQEHWRRRKHMPV